MGLLGIDSTSTQSNLTFNAQQDNRQSATDGGSTYQLKQNGIGGNSGYAVSGGSGNKITINDLSADVANQSLSQLGRVATEALQVGQSQVSGGYSLINSLVDKVSGLFKGVTEVTSRNLDQSTLTTQSVLDSNKNALAAVQELGKITATGGQSETNKTILYIVGASLAVVALMFLFRKS